MGLRVPTCGQLLAPFPRLMTPLQWPVLRYRARSHLLNSILACALLANPNSKTSNCARPIFFAFSNEQPSSRPNKRDEALAAWVLGARLLLASSTQFCCRRSDLDIPPIASAIGSWIRFDSSVHRVLGHPAQVHILERHHVSTASAVIPAPLHRHPRSIACRILCLGPHIDLGFREQGCCLHNCRCHSGRRRRYGLLLHIRQLGASSNFACTGCTWSSGNLAVLSHSAANSSLICLLRADSITDSSCCPCLEAQRRCPAKT